jgi:UMF1 family MFS transporter
LLLAANFVMSFFISDTALLARLSLGSAGLWWALFSLIPLRMLRNSPRRAVERVAARRGSALTSGFRELGDTLRHLRGFPQTMLFLVAYLIYYDGINTVTTLAATYGSNELRLSDSTLLTAILIVWILVVIAAYFMQVGSAVQFYVLALGLSIVLGGTQALSRSLYSSMIPAGKEAEYFSLYEISSSGSSIFGTLLFGIAYQETHSYRIAIFSLVLFFVVGLALLVRVDVARAVSASGNALPASLGGHSRDRTAAADVV